MEFLCGSYSFGCCKRTQIPPFTSAQVIKKIKEKNPNVKSVTIRCHVIGMSPNHPSSKHYPSLSKNHPAFNYFGNGHFELLTSKQQSQTIPIKVIDNSEIKPQMWDEIADKIAEVQNYILPFKVEFLERESFKKFCDNLIANLSGFKEIYVTGYFSETIRGDLDILSS